MKKETSQLIFNKCKEGDPENYGKYGLVSLSLHPRKIMQQILLEVMPRHINGKVIENSHPGFTKGVLCLTNRLVFYQQMTGWVAEDFLHFDINQAFDTVSLVDKWQRCGLDRWFTELVENWIGFSMLWSVVLRPSSSWSFLIFLRIDTKVNILNIFISDLHTLNDLTTTSKYQICGIS